MPQVDPLRLPSDAAYMADFAKSPTRDVLNYYLELMGDDHTTLLINSISAPLDQIRYWQGLLAGLRTAQMIPENVLSWAKMALGEAGEGKLGKLALG